MENIGSTIFEALNDSSSDFTLNYDGRDIFVTYNGVRTPLTSIRGGIDVKAPVTTLYAQERDNQYEDISLEEFLISNNVMQEEMCNEQRAKTGVC